MDADADALVERLMEIRSMDFHIRRYFADEIELSEEDEPFLEIMRRNPLFRKEISELISARLSFINVEDYAEREEELIAEFEALDFARLAALPSTERAGWSLYSVARTPELVEKIKAHQPLYRRMIMFAIYHGAELRWQTTSKVDLSEFDDATLAWIGETMSVARTLDLVAHGENERIMRTKMPALFGRIAAAGWPVVLRRWSSPELARELRRQGQTWRVVNMLDPLEAIPDWIEAGDFEAARARGPYSFMDISKAVYFAMERRFGAPDDELLRDAAEHWSPVRAFVPFSGATPTDAAMVAQILDARAGTHLGALAQAATFAPHRTWIDRLLDANSDLVHARLARAAADIPAGTSRALVYDRLRLVNPPPSWMIDSSALRREYRDIFRRRLARNLSLADLTRMEADDDWFRDAAAFRALLGGMRRGGVGAGVYRNTDLVESLAQWMGM